MAVLRIQIRPIQRGLAESVGIAAPGNDCRHYFWSWFFSNQSCRDKPRGIERSRKSQQVKIRLKMLPQISTSYHLLAFWAKLLDHILVTDLSVSEKRLRYPFRGCLALAFGRSQSDVAKLFVDTFGAKKRTTSKQPIPTSPPSPGEEKGDGACHTRFTVDELLAALREIKCSSVAGRDTVINQALRNLRTYSTTSE